CMKGTRVIILNDLCQWVLKPDSRMAWIHGLAGSGKSAIAVTFAEKLRDIKGKVTLALTFHCVKGQETSSTSNLVPTIGYHLAKIYPEYAKAVLDILENDVSLHVDRVPLEEQLSIFCKPMYQIGMLKPTVIIIDGLDEWGTPMEQHILLDQLQDQLSKIKWIRVVVMSRPNREIQKAIQKMKGLQSFDLNVDYTAHQDIEIFFRQRFKYWDDNEISEIDINNLISKADGLFIWANTAMEFIAESGLDMAGNIQVVLQSKGHDSENEHPHATLYNLYAEILRQNFTSKQSQQQYRLIIGTIISSYEPLTIDALKTMLQLGTNVTHPVVQRVIDILKAVLYFSNGKVCYHLSLAEFVGSAQCPTEFRIQKTSQHQNLAKICMKVLIEELRFNICNLETSSIPNRKISDLKNRINHKISSQLQYSARWWAHHVGNAEVTDTIVKRVRELTSNFQLIWWLECMSLMGEISRVLVSTSEIMKWAVNLKDIHLVKRMQELRQFVNVFSVALHESTPHLYVSACALLPLKSTLREYNIIPSRKVVKVTRGGHAGKWEKILNVIETESVVTSVAYSPNGQYVVSSSWDNTARIWNAQTGLEMREPLKGHTNRVTSVAYSPNGQYVVTGSYDKTVRIWNAQTDLPVGKPLKGHTNSIASVAYSPDGQYVVSGSLDETVRIWNVQTGLQILEPLKGHTNWITSVVYSPDGQYVVSGSYDNTVRIWNTQTGVQVGEPLNGHTDGVTSVAYSPDGHYVVSGSRDKAVIIWNAQTGQQVGEPIKIHTDCISSVAYSPDGQYVVSGSWDKTARIWNVQTGVQVGEPLKGHTNYITLVAYSPDGQHVVSGSFDNAIRVWSAETHLQIGHSLKGSTLSVTSAEYLSDGQYMVPGSSDEIVRNWNTQTSLQIGKLQKNSTDSITSVAYSPDGQHVISGSVNKMLRAWSVETGLQVQKLLKGHTDSVTSVAYSPDGQYLVSGSNDETIRIWNAKAGLQVQEPFKGHTDKVTSVAYSPNGQYVLSGSCDKTVRIWNVQTGLQVGESLKGHTSSVTSVAYSPDGQYVISGSYDKTVRIWTVDSGLQVGEPLKGHTHLVTSVEYSPDGQYVVSGSADETIRIWNAQTGLQVRKTLKGHTSYVSSVAYSPDGQCVVSGSYDETVRIWNTQTGLQIGQPLKGHTDWVTTVAYSPNGLYVVSGSNDNTVRIWNAQT
ncbi:hypothetical protein GYMLUDRAFT_106290, partial [Collybiopsis luxurians FD-317 M1]